MNTELHPAILHCIITATLDKLKTCHRICPDERITRAINFCKKHISTRDFSDDDLKCFQILSDTLKEMAKPRGVDAYDECEALREVGRLER